MFYFSNLLYHKISSCSDVNFTKILMLIKVNILVCFLNCTYLMSLYNKDIFTSNNEWIFLYFHGSTGTHSGYYYAFCSASNKQNSKDI